MTRTQPDPVVSPRGAPPSEAGARGGGGAPTGYSSERGRASREAASDRGPPRGERPPRAVGGIQYTTCSNCKATYIMTPESLTAGGGVGAKVRCAVCKHVWFQKADRLNALAPGLGMKDYPEDRKEVIAQGGDFRQERPPMGDRPPRGGPGGDRRGGPGGERGGYSSARGGGERRPYGGGGGGDRRGGRSSSKTTVFVGNLPFAASEAELRDLLTSTGAGVSKVTMVSDQDGRPKGFAFAEMATEADMRSVVDGLDGADILTESGVALVMGGRLLLCGRVVAAGLAAVLLAYWLWLALVVFALCLSFRARVAAQRRGMHDMRPRVWTRVCAPTALLDPSRTGSQAPNASAIRKLLATTPATKKTSLVATAHRAGPQPRVTNIRTRTCHRRNEPARALCHK